MTHILATILKLLATARLGNSVHNDGYRSAGLEGAPRGEVNLRDELTARWIFSLLTLIRLLVIWPSIHQRPYFLTTDRQGRISAHNFHIFRVHIYKFYSNEQRLLLNKIGNNKKFLLLYQHRVVLDKMSLIICALFTEVTRHSWS